MERLAWFFFGLAEPGKGAFRGWGGVGAADWRLFLSDLGPGSCSAASSGKYAREALASCPLRLAGMNDFSPLKTLTIAGSAPIVDEDVSAARRSAKEEGVLIPFYLSTLPLFSIRV